MPAPASNPDDAVTGNNQAPNLDHPASDAAEGSEPAGASDRASEPGRDDGLEAAFEVEVNRVATGGAALGSAPDGKTTFVTGAIPGEQLMVAPVVVHKSRIEAVVSQVLRPSPDRVDPPCPHVAEGCGGCDWQHITESRQPSLRREIVADCLRRLAKIDDVEIRPGPTLSPVGYRTTVRAAVVNGKAAYRKSESHDTVTVDQCLVAHPLVEELLVDGYFGAATEVVVRAGANTGERLVVVDPDAADVRVPDGVKVVGRDELLTGKRPHYHEEIGGLRLQISADSFFQCRADGAMALAELAGDAVSDVSGTLLDAYCGVGLFGALAGIGRPVIAVESNPSAVADATYNLGAHGRVIESDFERWNVEPVGVVIADPSRAGLRAKGCDRIAETGAAAVALVSCDPASLARDATLLAGHGYTLDHVTVLDLFGHTSHIETVSRFTLT